MPYDDACSLCGREGASMHVIVLDTGEHALVCPDCEGAAGDDLLVAGLDDSEILS
jgi:alpha-D-ribose 1-methylphosphonate 5-phosphate C-P lyase